MPASTAPNERNFFTSVTIAFALVVFAGFARTFFFRPLFPEAQSYAAPEPIFLIHGLFFTAWIVLLLEMQVAIWLI